MRILIVAATEEEVGRLMAGVGWQIKEVGNQKPGVWYQKPENREPKTDGFKYENLKIEFLITSVGMVATAFALGRHLAFDSNYDKVINLGIAGSFDKNIELGEVVEVTRDTFAELGAEDGDEFLSIEQLGFGESTYFNNVFISDLREISPVFDIKQATAITVNTVHGDEDSIKKVIERTNPQLESMEGAAFFYACKQFRLPCTQIRAVSNYVEKRNRDAWQIGLAIKNLNNFAVELLSLYNRGKRSVKTTTVFIQPPDDLQNI